MGVSVEILYRQRRELEAQGFPKPAFGRMSGERWDPVAIDRWLDAKIKGNHTPVERAAASAQDNDEWASTLDARVGLVVAGV